MSYIESTKSYTGSELEVVFFKPMLTGAAANDIGVKVLYNMPVPTTIHHWAGRSDILQSYTQAGWSAESANTRTQKTIDMKRVKAEMGFSAADYFSLVFENVATKSDIDNLDDLTGTELEAAETELFRKSIAESLRVTMWAGDTTSSTAPNTFDGFLKMIAAGVSDKSIASTTFTKGSNTSPEYTLELFASLWDQASTTLKDAKSEGELAIFVTSDIYNHYEMALDAVGAEGAYVDAQSGRMKLMYHGMEVIDMHVAPYVDALGLEDTFAFMTDKRNLVMAVNTADFPGSEIRMWYNPDEMQNRQRATFAVGCEIVDEELISFATTSSSSN
ncbi:MAG: hypothetical protein SNG27_00210 [Rikenellaceae bacterium]